MLKLVKYEFRKALPAFLVLLGVTAALEGYFLGALALNQEDHVVIAMLLLVLCAVAAGMFVFVQGIVSYSGELGSRSSYLPFMTPNRAVKIVGSKFLYTFANGLFFTALLGVLAALDYGLTLNHYGELEDFLTGAKNMLTLYGVYVDRILFAAVFLLADAFLSVLSTIGLAYLAITISRTLFRDKKWRWLPSLLLFFALNWLVNWIAGRLPSPTDEMTLIDLEGGAAQSAAVMAEALWNDMVVSLLPAAGLSLGVVLLSLFGCSALLEKKVSL